MLNYKVNPSKELTGYIEVEACFSVDADTLELVFPAWRPGRYELANFAKNIRNFQVNSGNEKLRCNKTDKNRWLVHTRDVERVTVTYKYYARELNAGSSYSNKELFYINPVNCLVYPVGKEQEKCTLKVNLPNTFTYVGALPYKSGKLEAKSLHHLFDSPFLFAPKVLHFKYNVGGKFFHLWFCGEAKVDEEKVREDFTRFTTAQLKAFGSFPFEAYHFIQIISPYKAYHGVEHIDSTVITLGPSWQLMDELYTELLGISSHELYHSWNIKSIRPEEMFPYDYSRENFSELGFIAEGVTTYMGDHMLFRSGVFDEKQYFIEFQDQLTKHFHNFGRKNYSVAESSFDTWLDGYVSGAPGRKVSIYTEGCLIAFLLDVFILKATKNKHSLDDVMRLLYTRFAQKNKGIKAQDMLYIVREICGKIPVKIVNELIYGTADYTSSLKQAFSDLGLEMEEQKSTNFAEQLGLKFQGNKVIAVMEESTAAQVAEPGDELVSINRIKPDSVEGWLRHFWGEKVEVSLLRNGVFNRSLLTLKPAKAQYYSYKLTAKTNPTKAQKAAYHFWKNRKA